MRKIVAKLSRFRLAKRPTVIITVAPAAETALTVKDDSKGAAIEALVEIDTYRQRLAADNPTLNQALGGIELTLARQLGEQFRPVDRRRS
ncbi:hypothetical protein [Saccharothrix sp. HUAS TT1]|uniref:hypothetical protein n=1 Tax=unclassified Saccharothrix TaxID=2593673 RepID=UPI00345C60A3